MSSLTHASRGGDFATSRKGGIAEDTTFILEKCRQGVPIAAIARMIGRAEADVRLVACPSPARAPKASPTAPRNKEERAKASRQPPPAALCIIAGIAAEYGLTVEDLRFSCRRGGGRIEARRDAYHALHATGRFSYPTIAPWFGLKSHHAVLEGAMKHAATLAAPDLQEAA